MCLCLRWCQMCVWMTEHFLCGLQWQCVDTGRLSLLDSLSLMYTVGQVLLSVPLFITCAGSFDGNWDEYVRGVEFSVFCTFHLRCMYRCSASFKCRDWRWDAAYVSRIVTSHARALPLDQGINVAPSGRILHDESSRLLLLLLLLLLFRFIMRYYFQVCRKHGITTVSHYRNFGGRDMSWGTT